MSMTQQQAIKLGRLLAGAREVKGLSLRQLAQALHVNYTWLAKLEHGDFLDPSPQRLAQLAEMLAIDPARIDQLAAGALADSLPSLRTYFRTKYELTPQQIADLEDYVRDHDGRDERAA